MHSRDGGNDEHTKPRSMRWKRSSPRGGARRGPRHLDQGRPYEEPPPAPRHSIAVRLKRVFADAGARWQRAIRRQHRYPVSRPYAGAVYAAWRFDLTLRAAGDLDVDQHHTVEDVGSRLERPRSRRSATGRASTGRAISSCRWTRHWRWSQSILAAVRMLSSI